MTTKGGFVVKVIKINDHEFVGEMTVEQWTALELEPLEGNDEPQAHVSNTAVVQSVLEGNELSDDIKREI